MRNITSPGTEASGLSAIGKHFADKYLGVGHDPALGLSLFYKTMLANAAKLDAIVATEIKYVRAEGVNWGEYVDTKAAAQAKLLNRKPKK